MKRDFPPACYHLSGEASGRVPFLLPRGGDGSCGSGNCHGRPRVGKGESDRVRAPGGRPYHDTERRLSCWGINDHHVDYTGLLLHSDTVPSPPRRKRRHNQELWDPVRRISESISPLQRGAAHRTFIISAPLRGGGAGGVEGRPASLQVAIVTL